MAQPMPWIKLETNMFNTPKLRKLMRHENGHWYAYIYLRLLVLAGECGTSGELWIDDDEAYTIDELAADLGMEPCMVADAIDKLKSYRMVSQNDYCYRITGWSEHQDGAAELERKRELNAERQKRWRDKQKNVENSGENEGK